VETGREVFRVQAHERLVIALAFHPTESLLVSSSLDGTTRVWDSDNGNPIAVLSSDGRLRDLAFRKDGRQLVGAAHDGTILVWDASRLREDAAPFARWGGHATEAWAVAYDFTGRVLASASADGYVLLRDADTGEIHARLRGSVSTRTLSFSDDGRLLAASCYVMPSTTWEIRRLRKVLRNLDLDWE